MRRVPEGSNSGYLKIDQLNSRGTTTAAHEYGHMLGYYVDKKNSTTDDQTRNDDNNHAYRSEKDYIMARPPGIEAYPNRRVHGEEFKRLNGGNGIAVPKNSKQVPVVDPRANQGIMNKIY